MSLGIKGLNLETTEHLSSWLGSGHPISLADELFQDAKDRVDRSEYRLAIIDARTPLEVFVDEILLGYFSSSGRSLEEACRVLDVNPNHMSTLEDALQRSPINHKTGHVLGEALNLDLHNGDPSLWKRWLKAKQLLERGAHRGQDISESETTEAIDTIQEISTVN